MNGIPYSVKGYRGSARLYSVQVSLTDDRYVYNFFYDQKVVFSLVFNLPDGFR